MTTEVKQDSGKGGKTTKAAEKAGKKNVSAPIWQLLSWPLLVR